ncbi:MAG: hypothetical protein ACJARP_002337 [Vicingaceae bacterium]|jgi:hypothetical protein
MKRIILSILCLFSPLLTLADGFGYNEIVELKVESKNYIVIHYHNWSMSTSDSRYKMISTDQDPFTSANDYAYVLCINKSTSDTIFNSPSPALTDIKISDDEKFIVGISKIMLWNPYQLVVFDTSGKVVKKQHISSSEAKLTKRHYEEFKIKFPKQYEYLKSIDRVYEVNKSYFIDFSSMGMPKKLGDAWSYLFDFYTTSHLSKNFSESVTNWVFWYFEDNPDLKFEYENGLLKYVTLLDPKNERIKIEI